MTAGALILAAGFSRRFGADKRLHRLAGGQSLLSATLAPYLQVFANVAVVLRDTDSVLSAHISQSGSRRRPIIIPTPHAALGMAASLGDGVRAIADWDYAFIGLGDMPYIQVESLARLDAAMRAARRNGQRAIVQPVSDATPGHPVGFSREFFAELMTLTGDEGARKVIRAHPEARIEVALNDPGLLADIDQPPSAS
jgi:molybdenum cofactor cytidylyltransferase